MSRILARMRIESCTVSTLLALASLAPAAEPPPTLFVHVNVVAMDTDRVLRDHSVLVEGGRIARIAPDLPAPDGALVIDGKGERFLMPGLIDSHMHILEPDEFTLYVANGVTTVRNMAGEPFHLYWRREIAEGRMFGPTLLTSSPQLDGGGFEGTNRVIVKTREEGERAVADAVAAGYDCIKVYSRLSPEAHAGIVAAAHRAGLKAVGHLPRAMSLQGALADGQDSIDHGEEYLYTIFQNAGEERVAEAVEATRAAGIFVTPNLVAYSMIGQQIADAGALAQRPELRWVDPKALAQWTTKANRYVRDFTPDMAPRFHDQLVFLERLTRELHEGGVPLLAGTDAGVAFGVPFVLPGWSLHEELERLGRCGLSPYETLATATRNPARFFGREAEYGTIRAGARADLLLLAANPLDDVAAAAHPLGVMLRGEWLPREALDSKLEALERLYAGESEFLALLADEGIEAAAFRFRDARKQDPAARLFRESALNDAGYALLGEARTADAVALFRLGVEAYPSSADLFDSLGEALKTAGDLKGAIASYERSRALNPWNANAAAMLAQLKEPGDR